MPGKHPRLGALILSLSWTTAYAAEPLSEVFAANREGNRAEAQVQREINALSDSRRALFEAYDGLSRELASLSAYNIQLQRMLDDQREQRQTRKSTLEKLADTRREVMPLLLAMVDWLEKLASADLPYRLEEHPQAIAELRRDLDRGDLDLGTRYERVLERYTQALADGRQVEVYSGTSPSNTEEIVDFLKIGRLALFYRSPDGQHGGAWDAARQQWVHLGGDEMPALARAMRTVRKETPPELLRLPLQAPTAAGQGATP